MRRHAAAGQQLQHPRGPLRRAHAMPKAFPSPTIRMGAGASVSVRVPLITLSGLGAVPPLGSTTRLTAHQRTQRRRASSESMAEHARSAGCGPAKQSKQTLGAVRAPLRCGSAAAPAAARAAAAVAGGGNALPEPHPTHGSGRVRFCEGRSHHFVRPGRCAPPLARRRD